MGGWGWPNAYVCLHVGWVGVAKCLRNQKNHKRYKIHQCSEKSWKIVQGRLFYFVKLFINIVKTRVHKDNIASHRYLASLMMGKNNREWVGF